MSIRDAMNSAVSMSAAPLSGIIQLNVPLGPASADAPLSPLMKMIRVSSRIPNSSIASITRPIWKSQCSMNPA